jgi:quinol-cytochrome oxidoreductase complex cytochrome b subunit
LLTFLQKAGRTGLRVLERPLAKAFGQTESPFNHLGSLTIFFCWIVLVSGIWLLIFFRTSVAGAFESVEYLTHEQWYLGGIMRSLHRYASDGAIVTILLHVFKEFSFDTYRGKRWFSWVTGMPLVWMLFVLGITGYWLVWDELAQYVAITSAELLDRIPIFTDSMAANFLTDAALSDRFFTLMAFLHLIGLPIFLVFGIWLHVFRLSSPGINPPRRLMAGTLLAMLVLSLIFTSIHSHKSGHRAWCGCYWWASLH